ncbi:hypothetical protein NM688_g2763 [Phlebia brevispora]|uniref:Uncharacterized protein n=1 Tax=Phlebia brevispora TaxID=194682 RepID=A0ACC1T8C8_9APHY|nr:hypothetical protein NM688_g2763 [Phlebia brevispora]
MSNRIVGFSKRDATLDFFAPTGSVFTEMAYHKPDPYSPAAKPTNLRLKDLAATSCKQEMGSRPSPPVVQTMGYSAGRTQFASPTDGSTSVGEQDVLLESAYSSPTSGQISPSDSTDHTHDAFRDVERGMSSDLDPASGPQRSRSASHSGSVAGPSETREKRKRSRVTPEQLAHLERLFAADRSPTAARRKEISEMLGMQERQTQIWFQNRRAKAKLQESRKEHCEGDIPPELVPTLSAGSDAELYYLVHEDEREILSLAT